MCALKEKKGEMVCCRLLPRVGYKHGMGKHEMVRQRGRQKDPKLISALFIWPMKMEITFRTNPIPSQCQVRPPTNGRNLVIFVQVIYFSIRCLDISTSNHCQWLARRRLVEWHLHKPSWPETETHNTTKNIFIIISQAERCLGQQQPVIM